MFKKIIEKIFIITVICAILFTTCLFTACNKDKNALSNYKNLYIKEDGTFKILYLTDLHFINSDVTSKTTVINDLTLRDNWAMTATIEIINKSNPDLLVVTGDIVFTQSAISLITGTMDNYAAFKKAASFIDSFGIPWAFTFGNHDEEGNLSDSPEVAKSILARYLMSDEIKNCLFVEGPNDINGCGNYIINILNKNNTVNKSLVFFDSGSNIRVYNEDLKKYTWHIWNYEYVHDDQLDWYEKSIKEISAIDGKLVESIVFQHIPFYTYKAVLDAYISALEKNGESWRDTIKYEWPYGTERTLETDIGEITYHGGVCNKEYQGVSYSFIGTYNGVEFDGGHEFERILSLGSTKHVFCGHDHRNTFSFTYKGIRLTYGMSIDYSAVGLIPEAIYPGQNIYDETEQRGGTLITLTESGDTIIDQVPFARNLYREELEKQNKKY